MAISKPSTCLKITGFLIALLLSRTLVTIIVSFVPQWFPIAECLDNDNTTSCLHTGTEEAEEELFISVLYATSQLTTLIVSPMIGILVDSVGFDVPILVGIICLFATSLTFAFANSINLFILARIFHGVGASFIFIAGTGLVSCSNYSPQTVNNIYTLEWLIYGFDVFGPVYGGIAVSLFGQQRTFSILAFTLIGNLCIFVAGMIISDPDVSENKLKEADSSNTTTYTQQGFKGLVNNSYITFSAILVAVAVIPKAFLDPVLPVWMSRDFGSDSWQIAMIYFPQWICFELAIIFSAFVMKKMNNKTWFVMFINLLLTAAFSMLLCMVSAEWAIAIPTSLLSFSTTVVRFLIFSVMAFLSRQIFPLDVGRIFAIYDFFTILPFAVGPLMSLLIYEYAGIFWLGFTMAIVSLCASPLSFIYRYVFDIEVDSERERLSISPTHDPQYTTTPVHQQDMLSDK